MTLSKDCFKCKYGTHEMRKCKARFISVQKGEFVYCPDGDRHLVDINHSWIVEH